MDDDPITTDPNHYRVLWENPRVRVLEYSDMPGEATHPHRHPDSVMVTLTGFDRRLTVGEAVRDVSLPPFLAAWLPAQEHHGENVGTTETRVIFIELKEPTGQPTVDGDPPLGPVGPVTTDR